jgi:hypothetical protein
LNICLALAFLFQRAAAEVGSESEIFFYELPDKPDTPENMGASAYGCSVGAVSSKAGLLNPLRWLGHGRGI